MALLTEKQLTIVTFVVIIVTLLAGAGAIYYFQFNVLAAEQKQGKDLDTKLADAKNKKDKLPELKKKLEGLIQKTAQAQAMVPTLDIKEYDDFINTVDRISRTSGVSIPSSKYIVKTGAVAPAPGERKLPPTVEEASFDIRVYGAFFPLLRFIDLIEKSERFILLHNYTITSIKGTEKTAIDIYELKLRITTYTYKATAQEQKQKETAQQTTPLPD